MNANKPSMTITVEITSMDQLRALEQALNLYVGSEGERVASGVGEFDSKRQHEETKALVAAAALLLKSISG